MQIELERIINKLGQPLKKSGCELLWQCPYCLDKSKNNLSYNTHKGILWCFASGGEHSKMILRDIVQNSTDRYFIKPNIKTPVKPEKRELSSDKALNFKNYMHKHNKELLNNTEMLDFIKEKRRLITETIKDCLIGVDVRNKRFIFPTLEFMTNTVIGFEYRPLDLSRNFRREVGGLTGLAQINSFSEKTQAMAILGGYIDCYTFYQHLKEIGQADFYHVVTSSNGEGATLRYLEDVKDHFKNYKKIYAYLDTDNTGIEQMERIKEIFPFIEIKTMTCGCKDFNEHYIKCLKNELKESASGMHKCPTIPAESPIGLITPETDLNMVKTPCVTSANYTVDKINRILTVKDKKYNIPDFFNIDNLTSGETKTVDYIFTYFNLDYG